MPKFLTSPKNPDHAMTVKKYNFMKNRSSIQKIINLICQPIQRVYQHQYLHSKR
jgi:hypothetical protein